MSTDGTASTDPVVAAMQLADAAIATSNESEAEAEAQQGVVHAAMADATVKSAKADEDGKAAESAISAVFSAVATKYQLPVPPGFPGYVAPEPATSVQAAAGATS